MHKRWIKPKQRKALMAVGVVGFVVGIALYVLFPGAPVLGFFFTSMGIILGGVGLLGWPAR